MTFLRKFGLAAAASFIMPVLLLFGFALGIERVFSSPDALKHSLRESGLYDSLVSDALAQANKEQTAENIPVTRPEVQAIIASAVPPSLIQTQIEQAIDGVYAWLRGQTPQLAIQIDFTGAKTALANELTNYAANRLQQLPQCPPGTPIPTDFDPFNAACTPKGFDAALVLAKLRQEIQQDDLLKDAGIANEDLKTQDGRPIEQAYHNGPKIYRAIVNGVYALGILVLLLIAAIVFLSDDRRRGLHRVSITFISVGAVLAICGVALKWIAHGAVTKIAQTAQEGQPLSQKGANVVESLANNVHGWWLGLGLALVVIGIAVLVAPKFGQSKTMPSPLQDSMPPTNRSSSRAHKK